MTDLGIVRRLLCVELFFVGLRHRDGRSLHALPFGATLPLFTGVLLNQLKPCDTGGAANSACLLRCNLPVIAHGLHFCRQ